MTKIKAPVLALMLCLPLGALAATPPAGINAEIQQDMAKARAELSAEMTKARADLQHGDLSIGDSFRIGKRSQAKRTDSPPPAAHITPAGELIIGGDTVATTAQQRQLLLDYRGQILGVATAGIDAGEKAAMAALKATDVSLFSLIVGGLTGSLERRIEKTVNQHLQPMVTQICQRLPDVMASQQALAASLPQFQPYANLEQEDVEGCESGLRRDIAVR